MFGKLRSLLHASTIDRRALLGVMKSAWNTDSDTYRREWLPYLAGFQLSAQQTHGMRELVHLGWWFPENVSLDYKSASSHSRAADILMTLLSLMLETLCTWQRLDQTD